MRNRTMHSIIKASQEERDAVWRRMARTNTQFVNKQIAREVVDDERASHVLNSQRLFDEEKVIAIINSYLTKTNKQRSPLI
jgi:hypothetical protein